MQCRRVVSLTVVKCCSDVLIMSNSGLALSTSVICLNQTNDLDNNVRPVSDVVVGLSYLSFFIVFNYSTGL